MTPTELKTLSDSIADDADFLRHRDVRRVWWKAMGKEGPWRHDFEDAQIEATYCTKCRAVLDNETFYGTCPVPDPIPGSLADAVEAMRAKAVEKLSSGIDRRFYAVMSVFHLWTEPLRYLSDSPRTRFLVFTAAGGALEAQP